MADWRINVPLDIPQEKVLRLNESKVIKGCAGSGKTLLAVHKAKNLQASNQGSFYFIVLTKSLRSFINSGIRELDIPNAKVLYAWEWKERLSCPTADYILVDEAQDFSADDIKLFESKAKKVVMFFGDTAQQVYESTTDGKTCVSMDEIKTLTSLDEISLSGNKRLYPTVAKVAQYLNSYENIENNCTKTGGNKPILKKFSSQSAELDWIVSQINDRQLEDVGILLPENVSRNGSLNGVFETFNYLNEKGLKLGVKYSRNQRVTENLDFSSNVVNIMPYHSSKGLQFKTVFLPFCESSVADTFWKKAFYVALTRTSENLIITYSNSLTPFLTQAVNNNLLQVI